jgi:LuxR family maltose regulon positive regulatory protein
MALPLVMTKLYIPPVRPELVPRRRLIERLDAGLRRKLTLISAPAGSGKTTLLSEWASGCGRAVAWISLDGGDNDPVRFLAYLVAALQTIPGLNTARVGESILVALQAPRFVEGDTFKDADALPIGPLLTGLINRIISADPAPFVLVLDDYQAINAPPNHKALTWLLDHAPPQMHLVIATRSDPPWNLSRLRGRGELSELRQADLRFKPEEIARFFSQVAGLDPSEDEIAALASRTEGWIAGLQMAALALRGPSPVLPAAGQKGARGSVDGADPALPTTDPLAPVTRESEGAGDRPLSNSHFIQALAGSRRYIMDYLVEEVLQRQPASVQTFLLQTSILDLLTGPLCDAVTGQRNSQATLEGMARANLFILSLDGERRWYRYHRLFADLLRIRLHQLQPEQASTLHRRASEWYERHRLTTAAIEHALSARDFQRAARLIGELGSTMWGHSEHATLSRWLEALPDSVVRSQPQLCTFSAWLLFAAGQHQPAEMRLQAAERGLGLTTDGSAPPEGPTQPCAPDTVDLQGEVAAIRALMASFRGDLPAIRRFARQARACLTEESGIWRALVAMALGTAYSMSGDMASAERVYSEAATLSQAAGNVYLALNAIMRLALNQRHQGRLQRAGEVCRQGLELVNESGLAQTTLAGGLFALWGEILCERNDLDGALCYAKEGLKLCQRGDSVGALGFSHLALARVLYARRDWAGIEDIMHNLEKLARESDLPIWITSGIAAWKAGLWIAQHKFALAAGLLQERGLGVANDVSYLREAEYLSLARLLIAQARFEESGQLLSRLRQAAEAEGRVGWVIAIQVLSALALQARGDDDQALVALESALSVAEPEGYVRIFLDEGQPMARLLYAAAARGIRPEYTGRLLAAYPEVELSPTVSSEPASELIEPLSERQVEVLQLIAEGLTNREIAQRLFLSLSTIKVHTYHIYRKLEVHKRNQAVAKARALGILPPSKLLIQ